MAERNIIVERFDKAVHDRTPFQSKDPDYTEYLKQLANQHAKKGLNVLYFAVREGDGLPKQVFGYFTASMGSIKNDDLDPEVRKELGLPNLQIPTLHIGMMSTASH